jgi:calcineurin-like phosphoesterase family protein
MSRTLVTSDTHFSHANIIIYCNRPFLREGDLVKDENGKQTWANYSIKKARAKEMDEFLIKNWNDTVNPDDTVYHLGDFCFGGSDNVIEILRRLNGHIKFIWGNHDKGLKDFATMAYLYPDLRNKVKFLGDYHEIYEHNHRIILMHYAMKVWDGSHKGNWHLYGHSHGTLPDDPHSLSFDVGIDCHNYKPIGFDEVERIMNKKLFKPIDHHGKKEEGGGHGLSKEDYAKIDRQRMYLQLKQEFEKNYIQ